VRYTAVVVDGVAQAFRITRIAVNGITKNVFFTVFSSLNGLRLRYWRWGVCLDKLDNQTLFACTCGAAQVGAKNSNIFIFNDHNKIISSFRKNVIG